LVDAQVQLAVDGDTPVVVATTPLVQPTGARPSARLGYLVVERRIDRAYLHNALGSLGADVALYDERGRMFGSAPAGMPTLDQSALMTAIQRSKAMGVEAESGEAIALHPLHIADGSLVIAAFAGRAAEAAALTDARQRMLVTALITLMGTLALGFVITRLLI